jgi:hypothetical protein
MIAAEAKYYELGLILGLISKAEVISWSDNMIAVLDKPPNNLLDISLSGQKSINELGALLNRFDKGEKFKEVSVSAFKKIGTVLKEKIDKKELSFDEVAQKLYFVSQYSQISLPEEYKEFCNWLDDEFSLVNQGIKDRLNAEKDLYNFLEILIENKKV